MLKHRGEIWWENSRPIHFCRHKICLNNLLFKFPKCPFGQFLRLKDPNNMRNYWDASKKKRERKQKKRERERKECKFYKNIEKLRG